MDSTVATYPIQSTANDSFVQSTANATAVASVVLETESVCLAGVHGAASQFRITTSATAARWKVAVRLMTNISYLLRIEAVVVGLIFLATVQIYE